MSFLLVSNNELVTVYSSPFILTHIKAVCGSSLCTRAPETRQMRTQTARILLMHLNLKHTAGWEGTFTSGTLIVCC